MATKNRPSVPAGRIRCAARRATSGEAGVVRRPLSPCRTAAASPARPKTAEPPSGRPRSSVWRIPASASAVITLSAERAGTDRRERAECRRRRPAPSAMALPVSSRVAGRRSAISAGDGQPLAIRIAEVALRRRGRRRAPSCAESGLIEPEFVPQVVQIFLVGGARLRRR